MKIIIKAIIKISGKKGGKNMNTEKITVKFGEVPEINFVEPQKLKMILEESYKLLGGNGNYTPYIWKLTNHEPKNNLISGILTSQDIDLSLTYLPLNKICQIDITSKNNLKKEDIMACLKKIIPEGKIEI